MKTKNKKVCLDGFGSFIGRDKGCLVVRDKERVEKRYRLFDNTIGAIQIRSGNSISSGALATCGSWNIDVLVLTGRGYPVAILKSLYDDSHVETRISQYKALENGKAPDLAKTIVISRIKGQNQLLKKYGLKRIDFSVVQTIKNLHVEDALRESKANARRDILVKSLSYFKNQLDPHVERNSKRMTD